MEKQSHSTGGFKPGSGHSLSDRFNVAIQQGDLDLTEYLIQNGADVNKQDAKGVTRVMASISNIDIIKLLIKNGAEVNAQDHHGDTVLHYVLQAAYTNRHLKGMAICKLLVRHRIRPHLRNSENDDAFKFAAKWRQYKILIYLLLNFPYPENKPLIFFDYQTEKDLKKNLDRYAANNKKLLFHGLIATSKVIDKTSFEMVYTLGVLAKMAADRDDSFLSCNIFCHFLQVCDARILQLRNAAFIPDIFSRFCAILDRYGANFLPFDRILDSIQALLRHVTLLWEFLEREEFEYNTDSIYDVQKVFMSVLNLLDFLTRFQKRFIEERQLLDGCELFTCNMLRAEPCINISQTYFRFASNSQYESVQCMKLHGKSEILNLFLIQSDYSKFSSQAEVLSTKERYQLCHRTVLIPTGKPLALQCLAARLVHEKQVPFKNKLPEVLCDFIRYH